MEIVEKNPNNLIFYANNPRENDDAVPIIMKSIERFGFKVPVMVDKNDVIICGHTRVKAALELGLESIPCTVEEDMTEEEVKAFRLVENKTHELSFWDRSLLDIEIKDLQEDFTMSDFGFTDIGDVGVDNIDDFFKESGSKLGSSNPEAPKNEVECPFCHKIFTP